MYSPIALFVFKRLDKTKKLINSLLDNIESASSDLIIFSDGANNHKDFYKVLNVRNYIYSIQGFKSIKIIERPLNFGLKKNILNGISEVFIEYDSVIILEDDLITSKYFLNYMNFYLNQYRSIDYVFSISAFSPLYDLDINNKSHVFLAYRFNTWGWGTWKSKWEMFKLENSIEINFDNLDILNNYGIDIYKRSKSFKAIKHDTWSIDVISYLTQKCIYNLFPFESYIICNGNDFNSTHKNSILNITILQNNLSSSPSYDYLIKKNVNFDYNKKLVNYYNMSRFKKITFIFNLIFKKWF